MSETNPNLDIEEQHLFRELGIDDERPKINSLVLIYHESQWLIGKYAWSKQQDTAGGRVFYLVSVRGYGPTKQFEVDEKDWDSFMPKAVGKNT